MNQLIQITTNAQGAQVVSAREVYQYLGLSDSQFTRWCKSNIEDNAFAENGVDFQRLDIVVETPNGGRKAAIDYAVHLDFAKKLCMVSKSAKAEEVRDYFLSCERKVQAPVAALELTRKELAMMVIRAEEEKEALQQQLLLVQPKVDYVDEILDTTDCVVTTVVASEFGQSAISFNKKLKEMGIQWKVNGVWVLTSRYADKGYAQMRTHTYTDQAGKNHSTMQMVWTQRGRAFLHYTFKQLRQLQKVN